MVDPVGTHRYGRTMAIMNDAMDSTGMPTHPGGDVVQLDPDHPGFRDPEYRRRRNAIAALALRYRQGDPVPTVDYTDVEHQVWRTVWQHLDPLHQQRACREYLACLREVALDRHRIVQLAEVNARLGPVTGFRMLPVAGLVSTRTFLTHLAQGTFLSTQYVRHHSTPLYTPEPDVLHEMVGHAATFIHPDYARLNRVFGQTAARVDERTLTAVGNVYWYTVEFGLVQEEGEPLAYGAGLLSSYGELGHFLETATLKPWDLTVMAATAFDPTTYQKVLFVAPSFEHVVTQLVRWLEAL